MAGIRPLIALVFNPGSASLKFEVIKVVPGQAPASAGTKVMSASVEGIGKESRLLVFRGREIANEERCTAADMAAGAAFALQWLREQGGTSRLEDVAFAGVRVVHGGCRYEGAVRFKQRRSAVAAGHNGPERNPDHHSVCR